MHPPKYNFALGELSLKNRHKYFNSGFDKRLFNFVKKQQHVITPVANVVFIYHKLCHTLLYLLNLIMNHNSGS